MGAPLSLEEQEALEAQRNDTPASIDDTIPGSPVFIPQSGLNLDIIDVQSQIDIVTADLTAPAGKIVAELSMQTKVINYYHDLLRGYENEEVLLNGIFESQPFEVIEATTEDYNIYKRMDPANPLGLNTRYFLAGANNLNIASFDEELYWAPDSSTTEFVSNAKLDIIITNMTTFQDESVQDATGSGWTDAEIISGIVDPVVPIDPPQDVIHQGIFDGQRDAITNTLTDFITQLNNLNTYLDVYVSAPFDFENATAAADAAAFRVKVVAFRDYIQTSLLNTVVGTASGYTTAALATFITTQSTFRTDRDNRKTSITVFKKTDAIVTIPVYDPTTNPFYEIRKQIGIELADVGEGLVYKKLAAEANKLQLQERKAKLERKLATYQAV